MASRRKRIKLDESVNSLAESLNESINLSDENETPVKAYKTKNQKILSAKPLIHIQRKQKLKLIEPEALIQAKKPHNRIERKQKLKLIEPEALIHAKKKHKLVEPKSQQIIVHPSQKVKKLEFIPASAIIKENPIEKNELDYVEIKPKPSIMLNEVMPFENMESSMMNCNSQKDLGSISLNPSPLITRSKKSNNKNTPASQSNYHKMKLLQVMSENSVQRKDKRSSVNFVTNTGNTLVRRQLQNTQTDLHKHFTDAIGGQMSKSTFKRLSDSMKIKKIFKQNDRNETRIVCPKCFSFEEMLKKLNLTTDMIFPIIEYYYKKLEDLEGLEVLEERGNNYRHNSYKLKIFDLIKQMNVKNLKITDNKVRILSFETAENPKPINLTFSEFLHLFSFRLFGTDDKDIKKLFPGKIWDESMTSHYLQKILWRKDFANLVYPNTFDEIVHWADFATSFALIDQRAGSKCVNPPQWAMYSITTRIRIPEDVILNMTYLDNYKNTERFFEQFKKYDITKTKTKIVEIENIYLAKKPFESNHSVILNAQYDCLYFFKHFPKQIVVEDNAPDNKYSNRFALLATDKDYKSLLPLTYRYSVANHSAGRVDAQHWDIRQAIQKFILAKVKADETFTIPDDIEDLLQILNDNLSKPSTENGRVKYRRFLPLQNETWDPLGDKNPFEYFSENKGQTKNLYGIKKTYQILVKPEVIELFEEYNTKNIADKYHIRRNTKNNQISDSDNSIESEQEIVDDDSIEVSKTIQTNNNSCSEIDKIMKSPENEFIWTEEWSPFGTPHRLKFKDLKKVIKQNTMITTNIIIAYLDLLLKNIDRNRKHFVIFNPMDGYDDNTDKSDFILDEDKLVKTFERYLGRRINIFQKDILIFPHWAGTKNESNGHFSCVICNLEDQMIVGLDSLLPSASANQKANSEIASYIKIIRRSLIKHAENENEGPESYSIKLRQDIAEQKDGTSCGIFMLEFIRRYMRAEKNLKFRQTDIVNIRKRIALELKNKKLQS